MVKSEYKYFGVISFVFVLSLGMLTMLLRKYALLTYEHFVDTCMQLASTFFSSGTHFIGLILIVLTLLVAVVFFSKTLFSLMKTQKKIKMLLAYKSNTIPGKLQNVLKKVGLGGGRVIVVQKRSSHAFSYGVRSRIIVLSAGLIEKLSSKQLEAVILHEMYHLANRHSLLLIISEIISSTLFFLPLVKEINKKMKIVFEKEADAFTSSIQGNDVYLNQALLKVPSSRIYFYPSFAKRRNHELSRVGVFSSLMVSIFALLLFLFPINTHADHLVTLTNTVDACSEVQCETRCSTVSLGQELIMSSNLQHSLLTVSY